MVGTVQARRLQCIGPTLFPAHDHAVPDTSFLTGFLPTQAGSGDQTKTLAEQADETLGKSTSSLICGIADEFNELTPIVGPGELRRRPAILGPARGNLTSQRGAPAPGGPSQASPSPPQIRESLTPTFGVSAVSAVWKLGVMFREGIDGLWL